jgi:hypothetical protein
VAPVVDHTPVVFTGVQVHGDVTRPEAITWAECLTEELPKIALPCAPPGVGQLHLGYGPP